MNYKELTDNKRLLAEKVLFEMYGEFEDSERKEKALVDIEWALLFLVESLAINDKSIYENLLSWLGPVFKSLNIDQKHIALLHEKLSLVLEKEFHDGNINYLLKEVEIKEEVLFEKHPNPLRKEKDAYLNALLHSKRAEALQVIKDLIEKNVDIIDIYLYIFQEAMYDVGQLWQSGEITVSREHYITAMTQYIISNFYEQIFNSNRSKDKTLIACAVGSELHELGIRMVTDIFELEGWNTHYLGANLPVEELIKFALDVKPNVIALSITMPYHLSKLTETIQALKKVPELHDVSILVGGKALNEISDVCQKTGADIYAKNALEGVQLADG